MKIADISFRAKGWMEPLAIASADIPQRTELQALYDYLDVRKMAYAFSQNLYSAQASDLHVCNCNLVYFRYKPSRYCHLYYRLDFENKSGSKQMTRLIAGKPYLHPISKHRIKKLKTMRLNTRSSSVFSYSEFPMDGKIKAMSLLTDRARFQQVLRDLLKDTHLTIKPTRYHGCWLQILSYRPERYCVIQITVRCKNGEDKEIVARLFGSAKSAEHHWYLAQALWSANSNTPPSHHGAVRPLGYDAEHRICLMEKVPCHSLSDWLVNNKINEASAIAAKALSHIHTHRLDDQLSKLPHRDCHYLTDVAESLLKTANLFPQINLSSVNTLTKRLHSAIPRYTLEPVLLHGDFSTNQILVAGDRVHTIDFSSVIGDPRIDVGNFLGRLRRQISTPQYENARKVFLDTYRSGAIAQFEYPILAWFEAITTFKDAMVSVRRLKPNWVDTIDAQITEAHRILDDAGYPKA